jgi:hypothetical protein
MEPCRDPFTQASILLTLEEVRLVLYHKSFSGSRLHPNAAMAVTSFSMPSVERFMLERIQMMIFESSV